MAELNLPEGIDKSSLSEQDIRDMFISPALDAAGWPAIQRRAEKTFFTAGRILMPKEGKKTFRKQPKRADYILYTVNDRPLAIVEAKANTLPVSAGIQQAIDYARTLDIPFAYSSNGDAFYEHDLTNGRERGPFALEDFPTPEELERRYWESRNLTDDQKKVVETPYYYDMESHEPRYYQRIAINRAVEAVAKGMKRLLIVMATGTGKTFTAFQIIHRLRTSNNKLKVLFLADRNFLIDQTINQDFKPFGKVMTKVAHHEIKNSYEIYMSLYGQWVEYDKDSAKDEEEIDVATKKQPYESLSKDFFDLIIVDECHRGSAREDSEWRKILEYFSSATQIGMTATPKKGGGADNAEYFCKENNGEPIYTYSLKQGIEDGFLAPYRVTQSFLDIDLKGYDPEEGETDLFNKLIDQRHYDRPSIGRKLAIETRREIVARRITKKLKSIGRMTKTIVFCPDQEEALEMRNLLAK